MFVHICYERIRAGAALLTILALALCATTPAHADTPIFVLHSYSQEYPWTRGQHEGFVEALGKSSTDPALSLSVEYLDTKRRSYDPAYAQALAEHLRLKYAGYKPAAIYVTDDNALLFARDYLRKIFPAAPVFFSGINDFSMRERLDRETYTGVFEQKQVRPNLDWLLRFDPTLRELTFVGDGSNTYDAIILSAQKELADFPRIELRHIGDKDLNRVLARLKEKPAPYVMLTTLGGMTDDKGQVQPLSQTLRKLAASSPRVVSMEDGYVSEGVLGGYVTSGAKQGAEAAGLLAAYLAGTPVSRLEPITGSPNVYMFDDAVLQSKGLELPREVAQQAVLLNPRQGFFDAYRAFIVGSIYALAATLFLVILVALFAFSRKNRALAVARREADSANLAKSQFLANMSHEIRTPLTSIIGTAELLMEDGLHDTARADALPAIIRNGNYLLEIISNVLDLAKVESGNMMVEQMPITTSHLLRELDSLIGMRARGKKLQFDIDPVMPLPERFVSDPVRLRQVLVNFLSNAIKFTEHGVVRFEVRYDPAPPAMCFSVTDSGVGMMPEQVAYLFQPFTQADVSITRRFGGSGLGLSLSRQLADLLGARIEVQSEPGRGSQFSLHLPLHETPETMLHDAAELHLRDPSDDELNMVRVPALRGRVLLAEDGPDNQRLISVFLRRAGLEVCLVNNGREAVERALAEDFDLVLMDIQMPEMDGVSATQLLRAAGFGRPIVALTANIMTSEVRHYLGIGCDEVLSKPIDRRRFYATLERLLHRETVIEAPDEAMEREIQQLATEFRGHLPAQLAALEAALKREDWPDLRAQAHILKGTAGSFGFPSLTRIAGQLEQAAVQQSAHEAAELFHSLCDEAKREAAET